MTWKRSVLVVANLTATSGELLDVLEERAARQPSSFTLIVPATPFAGGRAAANEKLAEAIERLRGSGLEVDGSVGDADPIVAVTEAWDPRRYDEIVISTLPMRFSKWLHAGLPERIEKLTGAPVTHVVAQPAKAPVEPVPAPEHPHAALGPLSVLGWGGHKAE
jgi:GABA permease